jgi:hypothetical protein
MWLVLGIAPTQNVLLIRRAYAGALKRANPDDDPVGFANLRQAYEQALSLARSAEMAAMVRAPPPENRPPAAPPTPDALTGASTGAVAPAEARASTGALAQVDDTAPDTLAAPASPAGPSALDRLRLTFMSLQRAATAPDAPSPEALRTLLDACLQSSALENLSIQLEFEPAVMRFFAQTLPRTESLLEVVIGHWQWRERPRSAGGSGVAALVTYADNRRRLEQLSISAPRVHSALTRPPKPVLLWTQIVLFHLENAVREALGEFRNVSPGMLDPKALAWWNRHFVRPHIHPGLIRVAGVLAMLGILVGAAAGMDRGLAANGALRGGLAGAAGGSALAALWLCLVDWPRYLMRAARGGASHWLRLGWAPAGLGACVAFAFCPDTAASAYCAIVVSLTLVTWANLMAPVVRELAASRLLLGIRSALVVNVPLVAWWWLLYKGTAPPTQAMAVIFIATLLAFAVGQPLLWFEFLHELTVSGRQRARIAVATLALGALALLLFTPTGAEGDRVLLTILTSLVVAHRTAALNLTVPQLKIRHYSTILPALALGGLAINEEPASILRVGGILLMIGVALSMATCLYNERKASREGFP